MKPTKVNVTTLPDPSRFSYTHGILTGNWLAIAGQCGTDDTGTVVSTEFAPQAERVLERLELVVEAAGGTRHDIVSMTVFVTDIRHGQEFTRVRREFFGDEIFPTSALIGTTSLMPANALVEAQAWAWIPSPAV